MTVHDLPAVNATLNGLSAIFLAAGFVFIKRGNKIAHRNCMIAAFCTSRDFSGVLPHLPRSLACTDHADSFETPHGSARFT